MKYLPLILSCLLAIGVGRASAQDITLQSVFRVDDQRTGGFVAEGGELLVQTVDADGRVSLFDLDGRAVGGVQVPETLFENFVLAGLGEERFRYAAGERNYTASGFDVSGRFVSAMLGSDGRVLVEGAELGLGFVASAQGEPNTLINTGRLTYTLQALPGGDTLRRGNGFLRAWAYGDAAYLEDNWLTGDMTALSASFDTLSTYSYRAGFPMQRPKVLTFDVEGDGLPDAFFARVADSTGSRTDLVIVNAIGEERIVDAYSGDFGEASMSTLGSSALAFIDLGGQSEGPYVAYRQRDMRAVDRLPTAQPEVLQTADGEVLLYQSATRVSVYDTAGVRTGSADTELLYNGGNYVFAGPVVRRGNAGRDLPSLMYQYVPDSLAVSLTTVLFTDTEGEPVFDAELPVNRATTVQSLVSARVHDGLTYLLYEDYTETSFNDRVADVYVYAVRSASAATDVRSTPAVFYPNPSAVGVTVTIEADLGGGSVDLAILDALGRNVRTSVLPEGERTFEAPMQRGSYFVQLTNRATGAFARQHHIVQP